MPITIRRLGRDEDDVLALLARDEADFDVDDPSETHAPAPREQARAFLGDDHVLFWVAEDAGIVVGFLSCQLVRRRAEAPELLLYEIAVRAVHRRRGIGRALVAAMDAWMRAHDVDDVWLLADNDEAVAFYEACGFATSDDQATYMIRLSAPL